MPAFSRQHLRQASVVMAGRDRSRQMPTAARIGTRAATSKGVAFSFLGALPTAVALIGGAVAAAAAVFGGAVGVAAVASERRVVRRRQHHCDERGQKVAHCLSLYIFSDEGTFEGFAADRT